MTDFGELSNGPRVNANDVAELSFQFANGERQKRLLTRGWSAVFKQVNSIPSSDLDTGERNLRNKLGQDSSVVDHNVLRMRQLKSDFAVAFADITYGKRVNVELRHRQTRLQFPSDPTAYTAAHRKQVEGGKLNYMEGNRYLPTVVEVNGGRMVVSYQGRHVLTVEKAGSLISASANVILPIDTHTGSSTIVPFESSGSFYVIRDGFFFGDTFPIGTRHVPNNPNYGAGPAGLDDA